MDTLTIRQVCINKTNHSKTLHLLVKINWTLIESLVDIGASMLVMATNVVRELGIMHLVLGHETYKITSGTIIQTLGRITNVLVTVGKVVYQMIFLKNKHWQLPLTIRVGLSYENKNGHRCWEGSYTSSQWTRYSSGSSTSQCGQYAS